VQTTRFFSAAYDRMASSELSSERGVDTRTVSSACLRQGRYGDR
jgi:hypothetical protein